MAGKAFVITTYYQLIQSIHIKNTLFINDNVYCFLTNHSKNSKKIYQRLNELKIFEQTYYIESLGYENEIHLKNKIKTIINLLGKKPPFLKNINSLLIIDEIIYFNDKFVVYSLFNLFCKNQNINLNRMDEGIFSLPIVNENNQFSLKQRFSYNIRKIFKFKTPKSNGELLYTIFPQLYEGPLTTIKIPTIASESKTTKDIANVFNPNLSNYNQKYIFFTSVYDFEGGEPIGEYELVCRIADLVGKDNLLIKMHPRDIRTIYQDNGFIVDENSSIPWEVIQLSGDFAEKVFMTVNSGSVLSGSTMSAHPVRTYYMYNLCDFSRNPSCINSVKNIEKTISNRRMKKIIKNVFIVEKLEDILYE